jgi:hypothetical protein
MGHFKGWLRNYAGVVMLRSDGLFDVLDIICNYFDTADDGYKKGLQALAER